ncbi:MAG: FHA domain-containing protein, partial [Acidobacteriota bacterium]
MSNKTGKFTILFADGETETITAQKDGIRIGRLKEECEIVLDHQSVSRIHAGINYRDSDYHLANLSPKNTLTLNGRLLGPQKGDVLADGDTIQIGPFTILATIDRGAILLTVQRPIVDKVQEKAADVKPQVKPLAESSGVLNVFWQKRSRNEKEDWGSHLRPTEEPIPGKAMFNWRPTRDLRRPWRFGLFVWAFLIVGA